MWYLFYIEQINPPILRLKKLDVFIVETKTVNSISKFKNIMNVFKQLHTILVLKLKYDVCKTQCTDSYRIF